MHHADHVCAHLGDKPVNCVMVEDPLCELGCTNVVNRLVDKKKFWRVVHPALHEMTSSDEP